MKYFANFCLTAVMLLAPCLDANAFDFWKWPDGRRVRVVQSNVQVDLTGLRSGISGNATDRRFETNAAMFLANEIYLSGTEFFLRASEKRLPLQHDRQLSYITNVEAYWYSRYNLMAMAARSRAGIGIVHGPYLDLRSKQATKLNEFGRNRGELAFSNKDIMLMEVTAAYLKRSGLPRIFGSAVPLMLEFSSADPHFGRLPNLANDDSGRPAYLNDFEGMWWNMDRMDVNIDLGGVGQALLKKVLWARFFLRRNHIEEDFPGQVFLGNNAADGFRGSMLTLQAVSTMLMAKTSLFVDPERKKGGIGFARRTAALTGINPVTYRPANGLRYLPHKLHPTLIYMSDLPVRHYDLTVKDATSRLWDQASWLWAVAEFFDFANPRTRDNGSRVFGYQTPVDGSVMEQKFSLLAQGLANTFLANMEAMHLVDGVLVSTWSPKSGPGATVDISDLSLAITALGAYARFLDLEPERTARARKLMRGQADFLLRVAAPDGSYHQTFEVADGAPLGRRNMTSQAFAIRGLLTAFAVTGDRRYLAAARRTGDTWNRDFWDPAAWLYRNEPGQDHVTYTPIDVAAALAALRELALVDGGPETLERFKRFFVQSIDASGLMQSEDIFTGEDIDKVRNGNFDSDNDGIPFMSGGHGGQGIDTVFAARVEFDLSRPWSSPPANPRPALPATGEDIFAANCAICHGDGGVGNEGPRLTHSPYVQLTGRAAVAGTVANGRIKVGMPAWDGILTTAEIDKVVDYMQSLNGDQ